MSELNWWKSSYSAEGANCVCLAVGADGTILLRDSKTPEMIASISPESLGCFLDALRSGRFEGELGRTKA
ncbi:DUF397 domain-containing protein [Streptomyces sp. CC53]|uniref:DUF397 domain-containing protein n=1 Tax=Streptomyces sp. CC53 TaxID=1906740 RepID=UPI0009A0DEFE|nr:DUF397 domain-containing protein [Streptomyces sp. CC53]